MKVSIDIDCTPEEARTFLGLPDVRPLHEHVMAEMKVKFAEAMSMMEPEAVMTKWMPAGMQGMEAFSKMMWDAASAAMNTPSKGRKGE